MLKGPQTCRHVEEREIQEALEQRARDFGKESLKKILDRFRSVRMAFQCGSSLNKGTVSAKFLK